MADLYTWEGKDGGVMYGTKMAQNSLGEFVLEVKGGNGQPIAMNPKLLTKVVPHTIQIQLIRLDGTAGQGASRHIQINKGVLVEGDVFIWGGGVHSVLKDDTKDESAKKLSGKIIKLETQLIDLNKE